MQRNTGMHPFNAEPPMQKLQDSHSVSWHNNGCGLLAFLHRMPGGSLLPPCLWFEPCLQR